MAVHSDGNLAAAHEHRVFAIQHKCGTGELSKAGQRLYRFVMLGFSHPGGERKLQLTLCVHNINIQGEKGAVDSFCTHCFYQRDQLFLNIHV